MSAARVGAALRAFLDSPDAALWPRTATAARSLQGVMQEEGALDAPAPGGRRAVRFTPAARHKLQMRVSHQKRVREKLSERLEAETGPRAGRRVKDMWILRAGLSPPNMPLRDVASFCSDFTGVEQQAIGAGSVRKAKDAFAELLKMMNRDHIGKMAQSTSECTVYVSHTHDEASMRLRSYNAACAPDGVAAVPPSRRRARGRASKIQNNCVTVTIGGAAPPLYVELQPLQKKDAPSIAFALWQVIDIILKAAREKLGEDADIHLAHLITGDAVATNLAACKILWRKASKNPTGDPILVELSRGDIQAAAGRSFVEILPFVPYGPLLPPTAAVTAMLGTLGNIVARLSVYEQYPTALWKCSKQFNRAGWAKECEGFLAIPEQSLDVGFSLQLQRRALRTGSESAAVTFLMGPSTQADIDAVLTLGHATTLNAERKHVQDKKSEAPRLSTVPAASRNGIIRRHLKHRREQQIAASEARQSATGAHTNPRAVTLSRRPDFVTASAKVARPRLVYDEPGIQAYIDANREDLDRVVAAKQAAAKAAARAAASHSTGGTPGTNAQWMKWIEENRPTFLDFFDNASARRRALAARLVPDGEFPAAPRLQPERASPDIPWQDRLWCQAPGWFCVRAGEARHIFFHIAIGRDSWVLPIYGHRAKRTLRLSGAFHKQFVRLRDFCLRDSVPVDPDTMVYHIDVQCSNFIVESVKVSVTNWKRLEVGGPPGTAAASGFDEGDVDEGEEAEGDGDDVAGGSDTDESSVLSLASAADTVEEDGVAGADAVGAPEVAAADAEEAAQDEGGAAPRAKTGTWNVWPPERNTYFYLTDNPAWPDVKVTAQTRWTKGGGLAPGRQGTFLDHCSGRRRFFENEAEASGNGGGAGSGAGAWTPDGLFIAVQDGLRLDLAALGHGGRTGCVDADTLISGWLPDVLP
ncbi:unnamed protein product [Prorocentrum cordatum]|uniref:Uncharacterized protein n=1 Tax=Prorocentrum cordatum TaxID=2364126 RepID=A0ABN9S8F0_9DINO|nr:unnamed protein product [Polarella glacialis]